MLRTCLKTVKSILPHTRRAPAHKNTERQTDLRSEKEMRDQLSEKQVDKMVDDSFPASDPPGNY